MLSIAHPTRARVNPIGITRNYKFTPEFLAGGVIGVTSNSKTEINHLYGYSDGNAINLFDPLGLDVCSCLAPQAGVRDDVGNKICTYNCVCTKDSGESTRRAYKPARAAGVLQPVKGSGKMRGILILEPELDSSHLILIPKEYGIKFLTPSMLRV